MFRLRGHFQGTREARPWSGKGGRTAVCMVPGLLFLLAYLASYVHPRYAWWLQLLGPFTPFLGVVLVGMAVWVFRTGGTGLRICYGLLLGLAMLRFLPAVLHLMGTEAMLTGAHAPAGMLVVMTHNAKWRYEEETQATTALLDHVRPHIVAVQEASVRFFEDGAGYSMEVVPVLRAGGYDLPPLDGESQRTINQPVFSTLPGRVFKETALPVSAHQGRSDLARACLNWNGQEIVIYNVHLRSYLMHGQPRQEGESVFSHVRRLYRSVRQDVRIRAREAEAVRRILAAETRPFLLLGDFNGTRHNWEYGHLARGLEDAVAYAESRWNGTFHARLPLFRIDFILASSHWRPVSARTGPRLASDHRPVMATLRLHEAGL